MSKSIILIGMPGAGKSTLGILLAKELGLDFLDTDVSIQVREGKTLQQIIDESGHLHLRHIEEQVLLEAELTNKVIATGGSAVYSEAGMTRLKSAGTLIYLDVPLAELRRRIHNYESRGIAKRPEQSFDELFEERAKLYCQYADIHINCDNLSVPHVTQMLLNQLQ